MRPGLRFFQVEAGTPRDDVFLMVQVMHEGRLHVDDPWQELAFRRRDKGKHVDAESGLHFGELVKLVEDHVGIGVPFQRDDDPYRFFPVGFVVYVGYPVYPFSLTRSAILSMSLALLTWYGRSFTIILCLLCSWVSISAFALMTSLPLPVLK